MDDDALTLDAFAGLSSLASSDLITSVASAKGEPHAPRKTVSAQEEKVDARGAGRAVGKEVGPEARAGRKGRSSGRRCTLRHRIAGENQCPSRHGNEEGPDLPRVEPWPSRARQRPMATVNGL